MTMALHLVFATGRIRGIPGRVGIVSMASPTTPGTPLFFPEWKEKCGAGTLAKAGYTQGFNHGDTEVRNLEQALQSVIELRLRGARTPAAGGRTVRERSAQDQTGMAEG